ncbi:helix-turn-helix domain-containing protein [Streptomyces liangshanensis]|uniref:Helix-turn-helix domain-containing protein n=1 Tax=Streptomyces liangshanensis TaxID=2717324 RepID=A0A6G9GYA6_9ACTN|nr:helix-turn-helix transcriptional regulator [Streptomyces liangshanensis]QIQ03200.1 helix-turn-helix domain-containing protein [Streptomyces liangshanensis]
MYANDAADEPDWEPDLEDDSGAVIEAVGRQIKLWRTGAGMSRAEFGAAIGYGEAQVYKVESGQRIPKPEFLDRADEVLGAGGKIAAMKEDVAGARYPKKVRDLARLEAGAVELGAYGNTVIHGLLQTEDYARALFGLRRPAYDEDQLDRLVAARMARQSIFARRPAPLLTFVQEEAMLLRPIGGRMVLRQQLQHLLEMAKLRHVEIQVMPTASEHHAGLGGSLQVLKLPDGTAVGHNEVQLISRVISNPREVQILEMRYGMIRSQALRPTESLALIEKVLGET